MMRFVDTSYSYSYGTYVDTSIIIFFSNIQTSRIVSDISSLWDVFGHPLEHASLHKLVNVPSTSQTLRQHHRNAPGNTQALHFCSLQWGPPRLALLLTTVRLSCHIRFKTKTKTKTCLLARIRRHWVTANCTRKLPIGP